MNYIRIAFIIGTGLVLSTAAKAQDKSAFSLKEAQAYALENNGNAKNARLDQQIAEKKVWETTAAGLPQVSAKGDFQNFLDIPTTVVPANAFNPAAPADQIMEMQFGTDYNVNGSIQVSQLIFSGNYLVGLQTTEAFLATSQQMINKSEAEIKKNVAESYYTVLVLEENKTILTSTLESIEKLHSDTKILVEEDVLEATNASQLELSVLKTKNALTQVDAQITVAKKMLQMHMGMTFENKIELTEKLADFVEAAKIFLPGKLSPDINIDHQLLASQLTINELALKNSKANYLPTLSAFFSHQQSALRYDFDFTDTDKSWYPTTIWGLNLSIPIFSSGQKASQVNQAKLAVMKSQNDIEQADKGIALQMVKATADLSSSKNVFTAEKRAIEVAQLVLSTTEVKFKEGMASSMELTQAQSQYLSTQSNYVTATFNLLKSKLELDKLANKL